MKKNIDSSDHGFDSDKVIKYHSSMVEQLKISVHKTGQWREISNLCFILTSLLFIIVSVALYKALCYIRILVDKLCKIRTGLQTPAVEKTVNVTSGSYYIVFNLNFSV